MKSYCIAGNFCRVKFFGFSWICHGLREFTCENLLHAHNKVRYLDTPQIFALRKPILTESAKISTLLKFPTRWYLIATWKLHHQHKMFQTSFYLQKDVCWTCAASAWLSSATPRRKSQKDSADLLGVSSGDCSCLHSPRRSRCNRNSCFYTFTLRDITSVTSHRLNFGDSSLPNIKSGRAGAPSPLAPLFHHQCYDEHYLLLYSGQFCFHLLW